MHCVNHFLLQYFLLKDCHISWICCNSAPSWRTYNSHLRHTGRICRMHKLTTPPPSSLSLYRSLSPCLYLNINTSVRYVYIYVCVYIVCLIRYSQTSWNVTMTSYTTVAATACVQTHLEHSCALVMQDTGEMVWFVMVSKTTKLYVFSTLYSRKYSWKF